MRTISREEMERHIQTVSYFYVGLFVAGLVAGALLWLLGFSEILALVVAIAGCLPVFFSKSIDDPKRLVTYRGEVADFGSAPFTLPAFAGFDCRWYQATPYAETEKLRLPTREGRYLEATAHVRWEPDPASIHLFVGNADGMREQVRVKTRAALQAWSVQKSVVELYVGRDYPTVEVGGARIVSLDLTDLVQDFSGRTNVPPDFRREIQVIIQHAETVAELEAIRAKLTKGAPGKEAEFIGVLCDDWLNKIREGQLR